MCFSGYSPQAITSSGDLRILRFAPSPELQASVVSFFYLDVPEGKCGSIRTLPEGCGDVICFLDQQPNVWLVGPQTQARVFTHSPNSRILGAQLFPGMLGLLTTQHALELVDKRISLKALGSCHHKREVEQLLKCLYSSNSVQEQITFLEAFLSRRFAERAIEHRVQQAIHFILAEGGKLPISKLAAKAASSPRNLGRLFNAQLGMGPKAFSRIVRFQNVLTHLRQTQVPNWSDISAEWGFADQPHLVRECRSMSGLSPVELWNSYGLLPAEEQPSTPTSECIK